ncbi:MAG: EamA family transporter, partial [Victivallales bacterium]|nr:EamA family transporter [Victivallales bacterium]
DMKLVKQSAVLSAELFGFNLFILLGAKNMDTTVTACVLSSYFVFVPLFAYLFFKQKPDRNSLVGIAIVLVGIFFMMNCNIRGLLKMNIFFLIIADVFFAIYILTTGHFTAGSNPSILALGQLYFNFIFALICWTAEMLWKHQTLTLPRAPAFWGSVIFISFFIRSLYSVVQIYAQRYVSALNTSLIFSTEIIMTMAATPVLTKLFDMHAAEGNITAFRVIGAVVMVIGILTSDSAVTNGLLNKWRADHE